MTRAGSLLYKGAMADSNTPPTPLKPTAAAAGGAPQEKQTMWERLLQAVQAAVELQIVTVVGEATISGDINDTKVKFPPDTTNAIATSINLIEGDITSVVPKQFWSPENEVIRQYHQAQIEKGHAVVAGNIQVIGEFGERLAGAIGKLKSLETGKLEGK